MNLLRPIEILQRNPQIKKNWGTYDIGQLLHLGLISGKKLSRGCIVDEDDVLHYFALVKKKG